jgi:hypothetical protein
METIKNDPQGSTIYKLVNSLMSSPLNGPQTVGNNGWSSLYMNACNIALRRSPTEGIYRNNELRRRHKQTL